MIGIGIGRYKPLGLQDWETILVGTVGLKNPMRTLSYELRNRPRSPWTRNPMVWGSIPHGDSEFFSLSHARGKTKKHLSPINKIVFIFLCVCLAIDHYWRRNVIGTSGTRSAAEYVNNVSDTLWHLLWSVVEQAHGSWNLFGFHTEKQKNVFINDIISTCYPRDQK